MGLYPFNTNVQRQARTDAPGIKVDLLSLVRYTLGSPAVEDDDFLVAAATPMKVGNYTLLRNDLDVPRNVTVTHTAVGAADTLGTITISGTNIAGQPITEVITPVSGTAVAGTKAFKTITSITGAGWVINEGNDTIKIGTGTRLGLPDALAHNTVLMAVFNGVKEATAPTVTVSPTELALNTVDFSSAWSGKEAIVYYIV